MRQRILFVRGLLMALLVFVVCGAAFAAKMKTKNIIFVMTDGMRWEEVFRGASDELLNKENGVSDEAAYRQKYWRETPSERRRVLMPFFWTAVAQKGQVYGNRDLGSASRVENPYWFSFPGYSEIFCGYVDPGVNSNDLINNPNISVFEWLNRKPAFKGKVAAFGSWNAMSYILNSERAGFLVNGGLDLVTGKLSDRQELLNRIKAETFGLSGGAPPDSLTFYSALEYFKQNKPRVFFVMVGHTDVAPHKNRYDEYLDAARYFDDYVKQLWYAAQAMPEYRGTTTLILSTDHGRGEAGGGWKSHAASIPGSEKTWMAFMGPDTPVLGERKNAPEVTSSNIAATIAALLGEDYNAAQPKAGAVIKDVVKGR